MSVEAQVQALRQAAASLKSPALDLQSLSLVHALHEAGWCVAPEFAVAPYDVEYDTAGKVYPFQSGPAGPREPT